MRQCVLQRLRCLFTTSQTKWVDWVSA